MMKLKTWLGVTRHHYIPSTCSTPPESTAGRRRYDLDDKVLALLLTRPHRLTVACSGLPSASSGLLLRSLPGLPAEPSIYPHSGFSHPVPDIPLSFFPVLTNIGIFNIAGFSCIRLILFFFASSTVFGGVNRQSVNSRSLLPSPEGLTLYSIHISGHGRLYAGQRV